MVMPTVDLYTLLHPPAQVEAAEDHSLDCRAILTAAKKGDKSIEGKSIRYIVTHVPLEEGLKFFPKMEGLEQRAMVVDLEEDTSLVFLKYKNSKNRWDVVVAYLNENGMPIRMYYARGRIIDKHANVADPHDVIFYFYDNPEEVSDKFDVSRLSGYTSRVDYTCLTNYPRSYADKEFDKTLPTPKQKLKIPKEVKPKKQNSVPQINLRQKVIK